MILKIKSWCEGIIVSIILCIIIESLIPEGNNKKYVKVIIGIYIMYVSLNPLLNLFNYDLNFSFKEFKSYAITEEVSNFSKNNIKDIYILGIEQNIKKELENFGYQIDKVKIFVDLNYENIEKIELNIKSNKVKKQNEIVKTIVIDSENGKEDYDEILNYIEENYSIKRENILIK